MAGLLYLTFMGKHKKKHSKNNDVSDDILSAAALSIRKYRKVTNEIAKLSTGQKLVGSLMLLGAGYFYLDKLKNDEPETLLPGLGFLLPQLAPGKAGKAAKAPADDDDDDAPVPVRKSSKHGKHAKSPGSFGRKPAASPDDDL